MDADIREVFRFHPPTKRQWATGAVLFVFYLIATILGSRAFTAPAIVSAAAGIGLAGLVLEGISLWPAIYLAALAGYFLNHDAGIEPFVLVIGPVAQTFQAVAGALILKKLGFSPMMNRLRDVIDLFFIAVGVSVITPTFGMLAYSLNSDFLHTPMPEITWESWWTGIIISILLVTPLAIRWLERPRFVRSRAQMMELAWAFALLIAVSTLLFWTPFTSVGGVSLVYLLFIPLFWITLRMGPRFTFLAITLTGSSGLASIFWSGTATSAAAMGERLFQMELLLIIISGIFLIIVGAEEERKEMIKDVKLQVAKLEDDFGDIAFQSRAKSEFLAVLAHELRNPLAPMVSSLELLRLKGLVYTEGLPMLDQLDERITTIRRLLDDILDISRISENKLRLQKEYIDLQTVIQRSVQATEKNLADRGQTLSLSLTKEPLRLNVDAVRIEQIVTNLLNNASKFTAKKGHIALSARQQGGVAEIRVRDDGIGIDPEMLELIFEPFTQIKGGRRANEGLGIGLSITKRLVEMHGGTVEARSKGAGNGSEFIVRLPFLALSPSEERSDREAPAPLYKPEVAHRVLVVDDNPTAAHGIGKLLEYIGYLVDYAYTGKEALQKTASYHPNTIVLDIGLPDLDGYATARTLRDKHEFKGIIVALTGYGQDEDKQKAYAAGFDHHLTKPIGIADLQAILVKAKLEE